jgi:hypothetical protein
MRHRNAARCDRAAWLTAATLVLSCLAGTAIAQSNAPAAAPGRLVRACPATAQAMRAATDCVCTAVAVETEAPVWGVDIYSDDSSICRAARHAGVVSPAGGTVRVTLLGPQRSFAGAVRHGITSQSYGQFPRAFSVAASEVQSTVDLNQCPTTFQAYRTGGGALSCICSAEQTAAQGTVWGSDVYTDDSALCRAAVHAGVIPVTGGPISVHTVRGRQSYAGSVRNGVRTEPFGAWQGAFAFER